ncbi:low-density lipoprotein receptor class A domain-containing protein 2 [Dipodomys spectabilis]|uniref:low-density lipoprotein receptor class A domain-containing protein 2 n=1 Tax=Dipodomys spectabilis TaxID=105255 RepID=UPI001C53DC96|nr:low-density lipoprotein receptor class A domain-containing protein 2 [Dipodomys spectabilis]
MAPYLLLLGVATLTVSALDTAHLEERCGHTWHGEGLLLRSHATSRRFYFVAQDTDCWLWVQAAAPGDSIRFQFHFFLVYSLTTPGAQEPPVPADPCAPGSYLQFYEGPPEVPQPLGPPLCGLTIPAPVTSSGPFLGLRLVTRGSQPRVDFVGAATSFHLGSCGPYFRCGNGRCIPLSLLCDVWDVDNCGDGSDQDAWPLANCRGPSVTSNQTGSMANATSRPRQSLSLAVRTAVPSHTAAERRSPADQDAAPQDVALQGPWLSRVALASLLLLASTGLLTGLLWCCCSLGGPAWPPEVLSLRLRCGTACHTCYQCPGRVTPGMQPSQPAFQHPGDHP